METRRRIVEGTEVRVDEWCCGVDRAMYQRIIFATDIQTGETVTNAIERLHNALDEYMHNCCAVLGFAVVSVILWPQDDQTCRITVFLNYIRDQIMPPETTQMWHDIFTGMYTT